MSKPRPRHIGINSVAASASKVNLFLFLSSNLLQDDGRRWVRLFVQARPYWRFRSRKVQPSLSFYGMFFNTFFNTVWRSLLGNTHPDENPPHRAMNSIWNQKVPLVSNLPRRTLWLVSLHDLKIHPLKCPPISNDLDAIDGHTIKCQVKPSSYWHHFAKHEDWERFGILSKYVLFFW